LVFRILGKSLGTGGTEVLARARLLEKHKKKQEASRKGTVFFTILGISQDQ